MAKELEKTKRLMTYCCRHESEFGGICNKPANKFFTFEDNAFPFCEFHYWHGQHGIIEVTEEEYITSLVVDA